MQTNYKNTLLSIETLISRLMLGGIILSASLVLTGGILYLWHHGMSLEHCSMFLKEPKRFCDLKHILLNVREGSEQSIIQFGILMLIYLQLMRLFLLTCTFVYKKDWLYVVLGVFVLGFLFYSLG